MNQLPFQVIFASGEDANHPGSELDWPQRPSPKGWQSPKFCDYPQELVLKLESTARINKLQILSHSVKIASKIDLYIGDGSDDDYNEGKMNFLGYLSLGNNQNHQTRELKTVHLDCQARYLRLLIHECYAIEQNPYKQVGLMGINIIGDTTILGDERRRQTERRRGGYSPYDPLTASTLQKLVRAKQEAVEIEDYDTAKRLKGAEIDLTGLAEKITRLEVSKGEAVHIEDYDKAKVLKSEILVLRKELNRKLKGYLEKDHTAAASGLVVGEERSTSPSSTALAAGAGGSTNAHDEVQVGVKRHIGGSSSSRLSVSSSLSSHPLHRDSDPVTLHSSQEEQEAAELLLEQEYEDDEKERRRKQQQEEKEKDEAQESSMDAIAITPTRVGYSEEEREKWAYKGEGPHPLSGVPNYVELPPPEPLSMIPSVEAAEVQVIKSVFGEYLTRCFFSKIWTLRDAAFTKAKSLVPSINLEEALPALVQVMELGLEDKIAQIFTSTLSLLNSVLVASKDVQLKKSYVASKLEPVVVMLINKLGDGQSRIRDASLATLFGLITSPCVGPSVILPHALKKLPKKQISSWKTVHGRLVLLKTLIRATHLANGSGLSIEEVMSFAREVNAFQHSSGDVRDVAKELAVAMYEAVGSQVLPHIEAVLRKKQLDEYEEAFRLVSSSNSSNARSSKRGGVFSTTSSSVESSPLAFSRNALSPPPPSLSSSRATHKSRKEDGRGVALASSKTAEKKNEAPAAVTVAAAASSRASSSSLPPPTRPRNWGNYQVEEEEEEEREEEVDDEEYMEHMCQFCGKSDATFTEDSLDLHYFAECPLLMRCEECGQVIEIFTLSEHLMEECDHRELFTKCSKSGLAVRLDRFKAWQSGLGAYFDKKSLLEEGVLCLCPLCYEEFAVGVSQELIQDHYLHHCAQNPRRMAAPGGVGGGLSP